MSRRAPLLVLLLALLGAAHATARRADDDEAARLRAELEERAGWPVTAGAAPGYVPDAACADCHEELWESYRHVGMARSFYALTPDRVVEDLGAEFVHDLSGDHYRTVRRGDAFYQVRWRVDSEGERYAEHERRIDWVMGSGSNARTYFTRTPGGELYQLPVTWYSKPGRWSMSPGYDLPDHDGFSRRVQRRCMFCHNAYPDVPAGSDAWGEPHRFPEELPEGVGCQRCHGPGAEHVALATEGAADAEVRGSIVQPGRLEPARRDEVCFQCHLQPLSAVANTVRRPGRGAWSFRPGEPLSDYEVHFDRLEDRPLEQRFEINHHPYRLRQSACFLESGGELSCLTCHDPHRDVPDAARAAHYRAACLGCHASEACTVSSMAEPPTGVPPDDCVTCHMPRRRTEDVIEVVVTDHRIRREPAPADWLAPREEVERLTFAATVPYFEQHGLDRDALALHEALFLARGFAGSGADALERAIAALRPDGFEPFLDLGTAHLAAGEPERAAAAFAELTRRFPERAVGWRELGRALARSGGPGAADATREARAALSRAEELAPDDPDTLFALGDVLAASSPRAAAARYRAGLALRPADADALEALARLLLARGALDGAAERFREAIAVDPGRPEAFRGLGTALRLSGDWPGALRAWRRGAETAGDDPDFEKKLAYGLLAADDAGVRDPARALEHARRAAELAPDDGDAACEVALALALLGDGPGALAELERASALGADRAVAEGVRALALHASGRASDARAARDDALAAANRAPSGAGGVLRARVLDLLGSLP